MSVHARHSSGINEKREKEGLAPLDFTDTKNLATALGYHFEEMHAFFSDAEGEHAEVAQEALQSIRSYLAPGILDKFRLYVLINSYNTGLGVMSQALDAFATAVSTSTDLAESLPQQSAWEVFYTFTQIAKEADSAGAYKEAAARYGVAVEAFHTYLQSEKRFDVASN